MHQSQLRTKDTSQISPSWRSLHDLTSYFIMHSRLKSVLKATSQTFFSALILWSSFLHERSEFSANTITLGPTFRALVSEHSNASVRQIKKTQLARTPGLKGGSEDISTDCRALWNGRVIWLQWSPIENNINRKRGRLARKSSRVPGKKIQITSCLRHCLTSIYGSALL